MMDLFTIKQDMLSVLETVGICHRKYTYRQAVGCLMTYLVKRNLLKPSNPQIEIGDDPVGYVLSCSTINLADPVQWAKFRLLFQRHLQPCNSTQGQPCNPTQVLTSQSGPSVEGRGVKRKFSETDSEPSRSPMYLFIPTAPEYDSGDETGYSYQEYPTDLAHNSFCSSDSSDSDSVHLDSKVNGASSQSVKTSCSWDSNTSSESDCDVRAITEIVKGFVSDDSCGEQPSSSGCNMQELLSTKASLVLNIGKVLMKRKTDFGEDVSFWADNSNSETETNHSGQKQCVKCVRNKRSNLNEHCWQHYCRPKRKKRLSRRERGIMKQAQDVAKDERLKSSQESFIGQETSEAVDKCIICANRDANALIVHNQTAHNVCCYKCARKLQKKHQPNTCPACRRPIDRIYRILCT